MDALTKKVPYLCYFYIIQIMNSKKISESPGSNYKQVSLWIQT